MLLYPSIIKTLLATPLSLADLQPITQVSLPTLRKAMQELSDHRWIRIVGQSDANGGRPAMLFGLDDSYFVLLGVHVQLPGMRMIVSDLTGRVLDEIEVFQRTQPTPDQVVQAIIDYAEDVQARFVNRKVLGVGIAAPGFTDPESGNIISIGRVPGWQNFPICQRLRTLLDVPVSIANDVDCMAFAEFQNVRKSFASNLAYIGYDEGIKVSLFLNGELYKGSFGNAGLIVSHFLKTPNENLSADDQQLIMTISGLNQVFEREVAALTADEQTHYAAMLNANYRQRLELILSGAQNGLPVCVEIANMLNAVLTTAIANIIYMIQPDSVVIGGLLSIMPPLLFADLTTSIRANLPTLFANHVQIGQAKVTSSNSAAQGATYHFLERYLTVNNGFTPSRSLMNES